jgi:hypothetical protein
MPQQFQQYLQQTAQQFPQQFPQQQQPRQFQEGPQQGVAPVFGRRGGGRGFEAPQQAPIPAYDQPENRNYNMAALRQMMGGY